MMAFCWLQFLIMMFVVVLMVPAFIVAWFRPVRIPAVVTTAEQGTH
jgi:hypothetical protein